MTRRTLIILLIVSGGLNLFLLGVIATSIVVHMNRAEVGHTFGPRTAFRLYRAVDALDEPQRSRARALLEEKHSEIRAKIEAIRKARRDLRKRVRNGAVAPAEIEAGLHSLQRARGEARMALHTLVRQIAETLSPEQRRRFYRQAYRHGGRKHKWRRDGEGKGERRD